MLHSDGDGRISIERSAACEHLIHHNAQDIDISSRSDNLVLGLLWRVVLHDTTTMSRTQPKCDIMCDDDSPLNIKYPTRTQIATQVSALYQFHDDIILAIGLPVVINLDNVG